MKKKWKKIMATWCAAALLMTMPGMYVLADEMAGEERIAKDAENPEETLKSDDSTVEDVIVDVDAPIAEESIDEEEVEEVVGEGAIQVGDGVTATLVKEGNEDVLYLDSKGGTLWNYWYKELENSGDIDIIRFTNSSTVMYLPKDSDNLFGGYPCPFSSLREVVLDKVDTSNVTSMCSMFLYCSNLTSLDLSSFDTSNVTNMSDMFGGCRNLTSLDLSSFDTSNVTNMGGMFAECRNMTSLDLDLSNFDTSNVTDMGSMFYYCCANSLNLSSFDTSNVTDMTQMFRYCSCLTSLDLSCFDTSNVEHMHDMFGCCNSLTSLDLSGFDTLNVIDMGQMFYDCCSLTYLNLSSFDMSSIWTWQDWAGNMLRGCSSLQVLVTPKASCEGIDLPFTMYGQSGKGYNKLPVDESCIVLTKDQLLDYHPKTISEEVTVMAEDSHKMNEVISFQWGAHKLLYAGKEYDYDLAIAAAYINQGTYLSDSENETKARMKKLGFEQFDQNHPYNDWSIFEPWMAIGYQTCPVNGREKKIVCLNVRGTKHPLPDWTCLNIIQGWGSGFVPIGQSAFNFLSTYCETHSINLDDPDTILFLAGHSLGGAAISRLAIELNEKNYQTKVIAYAFGTPNYSCGSSNPKGLHTVWNEGDIVASMGGMFTSHTGQIVKFRHYIRGLREKDVNVTDHELDRYLYRTFHSAGKMSNLSDNPLTYTFKSESEDAICPVDEPPLVITNNLERADSNKLGTKYNFHCPVDVRVYNTDNILVGDSTNDDFMFTDGSGGYIYLSDDEKYVFLPVGSNYRIDISGTDDGTMNVDVMEIDLFGEEINSVTYEDISIEDDKHFILDAQSVNTVDESNLFVVQDERVPVAFVQTDGTEVPLLGSGVLCEGITWSVDTTGELAISGSGGIPSYTDADAVPWAGLSDKITSVSIGDGITTVGAGVFAGLPDLRNATVATTVEQIGAKAFSGCTGLETVLFYGDMPAIDASAFEGLSLDILYYSENSTWEEKRIWETGWPIAVTAGSRLKA